MHNYRNFPRPIASPPLNVEDVKRSELSGVPILSNTPTLNPIDPLNLFPSIEPLAIYLARPSTTEQNMR